MVYIFNIKCFIFTLVLSGKDRRDFQIFTTLMCPMPPNSNKLLFLSYTHSPTHTHRVKALIFTFILKYYLVLSYLPAFLQEIIY